MKFFNQIKNWFTPKKREPIIITLQIPTSYRDDSVGSGPYNIMASELPDWILDDIKTQVYTQLNHDSNLRDKAELIMVKFEITTKSRFQISYTVQNPQLPEIQQPRTSHDVQLLLHYVNERLYFNDIETEMAQKNRDIKLTQLLED